MALTAGEVPVGAVLIEENRVLAVAHNRCALDSDPSAHAEVLALRTAARRAKQSRLDGTTLYVTIEPCLMCCGALLQARVARLVFAAREPRTGGVVSLHESLRLPGVNHHVAISEGVMADECAELLQQFFLERRRTP
ncbi:MAG: tRNA adenosine(34) deaminase TadA [Granulosicoccus sp.]|nr:tRNA adenosine(34) deaminase TadA [Granulosicoccus sp.]